MTIPEVPHDDLWKRAHRASLLTRATGIAAVVLLLVVTWVGLSTLHAVRQQQQANAPKIDNTQQAAQNSAAILQYIQDCQTPGTDCYKRNQTNTTVTLDRVANIVLYATICTHGHLTESGLATAHRCIVQLERTHDVHNP